MLEYYEFITEDRTQRVFDFGYLQKLMRDARKEGVEYSTRRYFRSCTCQGWAFTSMNGIYDG